MPSFKASFLFSAWLLVGLSLISKTDTALVLGPAEIAGTQFDAPPPSWLPPDQPFISGRLCRWEREEAPETIQRVNGCIAITSDVYVPGIIRRVQAAGAIGVVLRDTISVYAGTYDLPNFSDIAGINISVVQIGSTDTYKFFAWLEQYPNNVTIQIGGSPPDRNLWLDVRKSPIWYAVQALMSIFCLTALLMALYKLVRFLKHRGFEGGVPQICLFFETLGNLFRVIYWAVDPIFLLRGPFSYAVSNVLLSIHVPMSTVAVPIGLSKLKWPFVVVVVVLFILEFASAGIRATDVEPFALVIVSAVIALIVTGLTSAFFLVSAVRVIKFLSRDPNDLTSAERRTPIVRKTVRIVIASAIFEILFALVVILIAVPELFYDPRAFHVLLTIKDVFLNCISFTQILAFKAPKGRRVTTGTGATNTTDSYAASRKFKSQEISAIASDTVDPVSNSSSSEDESSPSSSMSDEDEVDDDNESNVSSSSSSSSKSLSSREKSESVDKSVSGSQPRQQESSSSTSSHPGQTTDSQGLTSSPPKKSMRRAKKTQPKKKPSVPSIVVHNKDSKSDSGSGRDSDTGEETPKSSTRKRKPNSSRAKKKSKAKLED